MRLTTIILIVSLMQVSAASLAQKVNLNSNNITFSQVFTEIRKQTGYGIVVSTSKLKLSQKISANFKDQDLDKVLETILQGRELNFTIEDKTVVISDAEKSIIDKVMDYFSNIDVTGKLVDEAGQPIAGATIKVKGTTNSVSSNGEGVFVLKNVNEGAILEISYLGFQTKEVKASENLGNIRLEMAVGKLDEVTINAGYYSVTDKERTGSISRVTSDDIEKHPINNPLMVLTGRVPGIQITQANGVPGGQFTVKVRGTNTLQNGTEPLYVIDGVIYPSISISGGISAGIYNGSPSALSFVNPYDIESIDILKDADATAIYGSRGANGVILITTKKGTLGKTKVITDFSQGVNSIATQRKFMNTEQYLQLRKDAFKNDGIQPGPSDYDLNGAWDQSKYTDWEKTLIGGKAPTLNASLNVSGGTGQSNYIIGANYYKEGTVYPGDFGFKRMGIHSSYNLGSENNRFQTNFVFNYTRTISNLFSYDLANLAQLAPNQPDPYDQNGQINWSNNTVQVNPMAYLLQTNDATTDNFIGNLTLSYKIVDKLMIKGSIGYNKITRQEFAKTPLTSISPANFAYGPSGRVSLFGNNYNNSLIAEPVLNYSDKLWLGKFEGLIGASYQNLESQVSTTRASNFTSDDLMRNPQAAVTLSSGGFGLRQYRYAAIFTRLNYSLEDKYFLNLTARRDGSSRFGPGKQFANFGAIGLGWIFSNENLIKSNLSFLSFGKLRGSYGITGNDQIPDYGYLQLWNSSTPYQGSSTIRPALLAANLDFGWETNKKLEGAIQLGFFKDRLNLEVSYYNNRSDNQLLAQNLPRSTGLLTVQRNLPAEIENTGWEFDVNAKIISTKDFQWSTGFNLTLPKNKLLSYPGLAASANATAFQIGEPLNILKAYNVTVDKQTGLYTFEDKNGNGTRDDGDRYLPLFLGQTAYGGFQNIVSYKSISLSFLFSFTKQNGKSYMSSESLAPGIFFSDSPTGQLLDVNNNIWHQPGDVSTIQKSSGLLPNYSSHIFAVSQGNLFVVDASYIRLRNVSLDWSLPRIWLNSLKIANANFTLQAQNLLTLTNYAGVDPEIQSFSLPPLRTISFGFKVIF